MARRLSPDEARAYVKKVRWQFAKTMPWAPHEYTLADWRPDLEDEFDAFVAMIWSEGIVKPWPPPPRKAKYHHKYLELDSHEYWVMTPDPTVPSSLINRARLDPPRPAVGP